MKKIFIFAVLFTACKKETVNPTQSITPPQSPVYCIYQNVFGSKSFLYCAKDINEFQTKYNQYQQSNLNPSYEVKNSCNECK